MASLPSLKVRDIETTQLGNGVRVVTEYMPHVRSVSLGIWIGTGSRRESPEENGICHFIEHSVFKGTRRRSAREIARVAWYSVSVSSSNRIIKRRRSSQRGPWVLRGEEWTRTRQREDLLLPIKACDMASSRSIGQRKPKSRCECRVH